jgi:ATP-dependent protease Clp ATPase subunit
MIYPYQQKVYDELIKTLAAHKLSKEYQLPVNPRLNRLVIGSTGSGKSYLASYAAEVAGWKTFHINASGWIIIGARETPTWTYIIKWLLSMKDDEYGVIILDELDKIWGSESWTRYLRSELYCLIDGLIPPNYDGAEGIEGRLFSNEELVKKLSDMVIIGAGAFQEEVESNQIGFIKTIETTEKTSQDLSKLIQRELINRFQGTILQIPNLTSKDYNLMIEHLEGKVKPEFYVVIKEKASKMIENAVRDRLGARFVENVIGSILIDLVNEVGISDIFKKPEPKPPVIEMTEEELEDLWKLPTEEELRELQKRQTGVDSK